MGKRTKTNKSKKKGLLIFLFILLFLLVATLIGYIFINIENEPIEVDTAQETEDEVPGYIELDESEYPRVAFRVSGNGAEIRISVIIPEEGELRFPLGVTEIYFGDSFVRFAMPYRVTAYTYSDFEKLENPEIDIYRVERDYDGLIYYISDLIETGTCTAFPNDEIEPPCGDYVIQFTGESYIYPFVALFEGNEEDLPTADRIMESLRMEERKTVQE